MKRKLIAILVAVLLTITVFAITACVGEQGEQGARGEQGEQGEQGARGEQGEQGEQGNAGISAFETWRQQGHQGDYDAFLAWLRNTPQTYTVSFQNTNFSPITAPNGTLIWQPSTPILQDYDFLGWYSNRYFENQAIFPFVLNENTNLYARWEKCAYFLPTHRILLVFATEIIASVPIPNQSADFYVNHRLNDLEKQILRMTATNLRYYLDDMLEGIARFEVDYFFTTQTITTNVGFAYQIPEVVHMFDDYHAIILASSLGTDYDHPLGNSFARGWVCFVTANHAWVNLDPITTTTNWVNPIPYRQLRLRNFQKMLTLDRNHTLWQRMLYVFVHEFVHTAGNVVYNISGFVDCDWFHRVLFEFPQSHMCLDGIVHDNNYWVYQLKVARLYLRDEAEFRGTRVGIPKEFWLDPRNFTDFREAFCWIVGL